MGWHDEEQEAGRLPAWVGETTMWIVCLVVAVMPTALALTVWRSWFGPVSAVAGTASYIVAFTLMVVAIKPWTVR